MPLRAGPCRTRTPPFDGLALLGDPQIGGSSNETTIPDLRFILPRVKMNRQTGAGKLKKNKCSGLGLTAITMPPCQLPLSLFDVESDIQRRHGMRQRPDGDPIHAGQRNRADGL